MSEENYFKQLNHIKCETDKKNKLTYISWADAWAEVKKAYPDSNYTIYETADGFPFWESKFGIDCKVGVTINGIEHIVRLPVMDGANNSMTDKEQKYIVKKIVYENNQKVWDKEVGAWKTKEVEVIIKPATQFDINKTTQRAFAKAIAMHGVGLYVFRGEDLPEELPKPAKEPFTHIHLDGIAEGYNDIGSDGASAFMADYPNVDLLGKGMYVIKSLKQEYTDNQTISDEFLETFKKDIAKREATNNFKD